MSGDSEFSATAHGVVTLPDSAAAPVTAQVQVQADESALSAAANALQSAATLANTMHGTKGVPKAVVTELAKQESALVAARTAATTAATAAGTWLGDNPVPAPTPPEPVPAPTPTPTPVPSVFPYIFGINEHWLMWNPPGEYPVALLTALGVKVFRNDLIASGGGYPGALGTAQCTSVVQGWVAALRAVDIQPLIVVTFTTLPDPTFAANLAALAKACPGVWWEIGNELDYQAPTITPAAYVPFFASVVTAMHAADPTCLVGPAPVANINPGGDGWNDDAAEFVDGLAKSGMDFFSFHNYPYPSDVAPNAPWDGTDSAETLIPKFTAQCTAWGVTVPIWMTECGSPSAAGTMTPVLQSQYVLQLLQSPQVEALPVVIPYELGDGGNETYGWMTAGDAAPKPVYTAVAALG